MSAHNFTDLLKSTEKQGHRVGGVVHPPVVGGPWMRSLPVRGLYTRNPFAALGYLTAWFVSGGRYGRLLWWTDQETFNERMGWP